MDLKSIHTIFTDRIFRIPSYQRGYTWSNDSVIKSGNDLIKVKGQLKDLWDDIRNIPNNSWHYTGLLTLVKTNNQYDWLPNHNQYLIVDGQQRITTILIIIRIIIEKARENGIQLETRKGDEDFKYCTIGNPSIQAFVFGYEKDNPSDKFFRKYILNIDSVEDDSKESVYTNNLKNAKYFFEILVDDLIKDDLSKLKWLYKTLTTNLRFNEYILPQELDEFVVFETMNNRGKPLSELEKLKNRLMYLNSKLPVDNSISRLDTISESQFLDYQRNELEKNINTSWITIYNSLGANKYNPLSDEGFLRNHWIAYFDEYDRSKSQAYSGFLFDEYFILQNIYGQIINHKTINDYIKSLQRASIVWNQINNPIFFNADEIELKNVIISLGRAGLKPSFKPLLMSILLRNDKLDFINVIKLLEEYSFKIFTISNRQSNTGDSKLYRLAFQVLKNNLSSDITYEVIKQHLDWYYSFSLFKTQITELFEVSDKKGYYGWSGRFYFLFEYDSYLRTNNKTSTIASMINWEDFTSKNSIEHIFPQSAAKSFEEYSEDTFTETKKISYDQIQENWSDFKEYSHEERKRFCNSLGNLLAMTSRDNASLSNESFKNKKDLSIKGPGYKNRGYCFDSLSAILVSKHEKWTPETIIERGQQMLEFLWIKLHPGKPFLLSKNQILELLGLHFIVEKQNFFDAEKKPADQP